MALIYFFSSQPASNLPVFTWDLLVKKGGHMAGYGMLGLAWAWALSADWPPDDRRRRLALLLTVLYAASDEWHQSFVPGRHPSLLDVGIDAAGALLALWPGIGLLTRIQSRNRRPLRARPPSARR